MRDDPLKEIRLARHGWAFCNKKMLEGRIRDCEQLRDQLPVRIRSEADNLIRPLKAALEELEGEQSRK